MITNGLDFHKVCTLFWLEWELQVLTQSLTLFSLVPVVFIVAAHIASIESLKNVAP